MNDGTGRKLRLTLFPIQLAVSSIWSVLGLVGAFVSGSASSIQRLDDQQIAGHPCDSALVRPILM
jgi:hypothetical protein